MPPERFELLRCLDSYTMAKNRHRFRQYPYRVYMTTHPCQLPAPTMGK